MKTELSSLSVFMPAFNEEANIVRTIDDAIKHVTEFTSDYEIIVVNDGSKDRTAEVVKAFAKNNPRVRLISHKTNKGYGAAVKTGLKSCTKDWIFFTDSDGQFKFDEMHKLVLNIEKADLIIGYRRKRMDPFHRIFVAQVLLKTWNRILFGLTVKDVDCAYKLFPRKVVESVNLITESAITVTEFIVKAQKAGYKVYQIPVRHYPRKHGTQTGGNLKVIWKAARESFELFKQLRFGQA